MPNDSDEQSTSVNISSNVLFHFTKTFDIIVSILKNGLYVHFCPEYGVFENDVDPEHPTPPPFALPMVCFCDLPLFLIKSHLQFYGPYGIGLKKSWGMEQGISPVLYVHGKALLLYRLSQLYESASNSKDGHSAIVSALLTVKAYEKPYEGRAWRDDNITRTIRFYNEREWRFVPPLRDEDAFMLNTAEYEDNTTRESANAKLSKTYPLKFSAEDVLYIIVQTDSEVRPMISALRNMKGIYTEEDIQILETAVISVDRIREDM